MSQSQAQSRNAADSALMTVLFTDLISQSQALFKHAKTSYDEQSMTKGALVSLVYYQTISSERFEQGLSFMPRKHFDKCQDVLSLIDTYDPQTSFVVVCIVTGSKNMVEGRILTPDSYQTVLNKRKDTQDIVLKYSTVKDAMFSSQCMNCQKVSTTMKVCVQCKTAQYCSKQCQIQHWHKNHKLRCEQATNLTHYPVSNK